MVDAMLIITGEIAEMAGCLVACFFASFSMALVPFPTRAIGHRGRRTILFLTLNFGLATIAAWVIWSEWNWRPAEGAALTLLMFYFICCGIYVAAQFGRLSSPNIFICAGGALLGFYLFLILIRNTEVGSLVLFRMISRIQALDYLGRREAFLALIIGAMFLLGICKRPLLRYGKYLTSLRRDDLSRS